VYYRGVKTKIETLDTYIVYRADGSEFGRLDPETTQLLFAEAQARGVTPDAFFLATIERGLEEERRRAKWGLAPNMPPAAEKDHLAEIVPITPNT
jgi:hypothetical protein